MPIRKRKTETTPPPDTDENTFGSPPWFTVSLGAGVSFSVSWAIGVVATVALFTVNLTDGDVDLLDGLIMFVFSLAGG